MRRTLPRHKDLDDAGDERAMTRKLAWLMNGRSWSFDTDEEVDELEKLDHQDEDPVDEDEENLTKNEEADELAMMRTSSLISGRQRTSREMPSCHK